MRTSLVDRSRSLRLRRLIELKGGKREGWGAGARRDEWMGERERGEAKVMKANEDMSEKEKKNFPAMGNSGEETETEAACSLCVTYT